MKFASELLNKRKPNEARLALLFIDNIAELLLHNKALFQLKFIDSEERIFWKVVAMEKIYDQKKIDKPSDLIAMKERLKPKCSVKKKRKN